FKETHEELALKVDLDLANDLKVIFCCGEVLEQRESNQQEIVVLEQLEESLFHLSAAQFANVVIAYEPVWAIGTGKTASSEQAQEIHAFIRQTLADKYGDEVAQNTTIQYGGSCKPSNAKELFANEDVDGGLIGGASLKAEDFVAIGKSY
ncbi:MAG: triosephosphate isomerase, partial [Arenicella sp.]